MKKITTVFMLMLLGLTDCATTARSLRQHPKATVRWPSQTGDQVGALVGFPVSLCLYPISATVGAMSDNPETQAWSPLYPAIVCKNTGTVLLGGVPWLMFGWWGETKPRNPEQNAAHVFQKPRAVSENGER